MTICQFFLEHLGLRKVPDTVKNALETDLDAASSDAEETYYSLVTGKLQSTARSNASARPSGCCSSSSTEQKACNAQSCCSSALTRMHCGGALSSVLVSPAAEFLSSRTFRGLETEIKPDDERL